MLDDDANHVNKSWIPVALDITALNWERIFVCRHFKGMISMNSLLLEAKSEHSGWNVPV